jgi:DNA-binding NtrC family response regulator
VLEDREFYPLGSRRTRKVDVRIISATNRQLKSLVDQGLFREDLFYRLNVMRIELPPLRKRRGDLPLLIRHIARNLCAARAAAPPAISKTAMQILLNYDYPGNVRELENILEHALIICREAMVQPDHLPDYVRQVQQTAAASKNAGWRGGITKPGAPAHPGGIGKMQWSSLQRRAGTGNGTHHLVAQDEKIRHPLIGCRIIIGPGVKDKKITDRDIKSNELMADHLNTIRNLVISSTSHRAE